jgi:stage IV sporulation protein B
MRKIVRTVSVFLILAIISVSTLTGYYIYYLPNSFYVEKGDTLKLSCMFDIQASNITHIEATSSNDTNVIGSKVSLKLFGLVPIKDVNVKQVEAPLVIPGGNPFGIKLITEGVMVVGLSDVDCCEGNISPAAKSGIKAGDIIISINGNKITCKEDIADAVMKSQGEKLVINVRRNSKILTFEITPKYSLSDACYKSGMWVRDSSAGIGTITFYDPNTKMFGGLGHPVCDSDTGEILPLHSGEVVPVTINGVNKGRSGQPGELIGSFSSNFSMGSLLLNNQSGLFGVLDSAPNKSYPMPIAYKQEVKRGKATILTTLKGNTPKEYEIEIEKVDFKGNELSKNMIIHITDAELLEQSGGILQGMSGSPIIQNGKIVGAVTHVFVNDPTRGYGIFAETMYNYTQKLAENAA